VYAVLAFCAQTAVLSQRRQVPVAVVIAATTFGIGIEVYQSTLDGRTGSAYDALANLAGAMVGAGVAYWLTPWWGRWLRV
jgi:VanZ family protein